MNKTGKQIEQQGKKKTKTQSKLGSAMERPAQTKAVADENQFPIVAIGASAGGLESLEDFFANVPPNSGMSFVVIQHLSPDFKSVMDELLGRRTKTAICQAEDGMPLRPNTIFLIPPTAEAILSDSKFRLRNKDRNEALTLPIDHFFRSLAQEVGSRTVAVVLSGSGSDGSRGIADVSESGGLVIAQSAKTAKFDSMPLSAQNTGVVDLILESSKMPQAIIQHFDGQKTSSSELASIKKESVGADLIFELLHEAYGIDFSHYKSTTVGRRIERRLGATQIGSIADYATHLKTNPQELDSLYHDLLIGVTQFFRDANAFRALESETIPAIVESANDDSEIRVWVSGCATGEEAYSIAILFHEELTRRKRSVNVKIFATDVHKRSLEFAGIGSYPHSAFKDVSAQRLKRYFSPITDGFAVEPELRKMIVFAQHNVLRDAPFTRLDMISCRNLLIYFRPKAQRKALSLFHFGLKTNGALVLGPSETPGELSDEFDTLNKRWRIFRKRRDIRLPTDMQYPTSPRDEAKPLAATSTLNLPANSRGLQEAGLFGAYDWLLERHMPPAILIDDRHQLLHVFGSAGKLMNVRDGRPSNDALDSFGDELRTAVVGAVQRVQRDRKPMRYSGIKVKKGEMAGTYRVRIEAVENPRAVRQQFLISFELVDENEVVIKSAEENLVEQNAKNISHDRIQSLEGELRFAKENLQATVEELETSNEELQATNEELVASNEELQSTNEELHSVNEELYSVNAEYQKKIDDLTELTDDLDNLIESTDVATVFLDRDLRIRKFTPQIGPVFKLMPQDAGRSIDSFAHYLDHPGLIDDLRQVLETGAPREDEVQDLQGNWLYLRVLPYRSSQEIDGVVLTLIDVNALKQTQQSLASAVQDRERFLAMLSHEMRNPVSAILSASHLLKSDRANAKVISNAVSVIQRQSAHVSRLLDDLLDVSRMTQNKLVMNTQPVDLRAVISQAIESTAPIVESHSHSLSVDCCSQPLFIDGDPNRLRQVVSNLVANAVKYSPASGKISVLATVAGEEAVVRVRDEGEGISPEMLQYIFEPFTQLPRTKDQREGGMGVGLSLVKFIIEGHHGTIAAESDGIGLGSEFTIRLPLLPEQEQAELSIRQGQLAISSNRDRSPAVSTNGIADSEVNLSIHPKQLSANGESNEVALMDIPRAREDLEVRSITVIEDQRDNREMLQALLEIEGFEVTVAKSGEEGHRATVESKADAALIDIGLPSQNGYRVAESLREEFGEDILLLALTGHGQANDVVQAMNSGFDAHLVKPLDLDRLLKLLKREQNVDSS